jgi:hypothetical protein
MQAVGCQTWFEAGMGSAIGVDVIDVVIPATMESVMDRVKGRLGDIAVACFAA